MGYITLYHYTSEENAKKIGQQKLLKVSNPETRDAVFGKGVYLTTYGPENGKTLLSKNNWDGRTKINEKLEAYVKIQINESDPNLKDVSQGGRNIFLYTKDIKLDGSSVIATFQ